MSRATVHGLTAQIAVEMFLTGLHMTTTRLSLSPSALKGQSPRSRSMLTSRRSCRLIGLSVLPLVRSDPNAERRLLPEARVPQPGPPGELHRPPQPPAARPLSEQRPARRPAPETPREPALWGGGPPPQQEVHRVATATTQCSRHGNGPRRARRPPTPRRHQQQSHRSPWRRDTTP